MPDLEPAPDLPPPVPAPPVLAPPAFVAPGVGEALQLAYAERRRIRTEGLLLLKPSAESEPCT